MREHYDPGGCNSSFCACNHGIWGSLPTRVDAIETGIGMEEREREREKERERERERESFATSASFCH